MRNVCSRSLFAVISSLLSICAQAREELDVTIVDSQDRTDTYTYAVPGYTSATSSANASCFGSELAANCSGSSQTTGLSTPGYVGSYEVRGVTLSLQLPDGRIVVVNCDSKTAWKEGPGVKRDCRSPLIKNIKAEFWGDNAKLKWPVSIDGKKLQSETYPILGVLDGR